MRKTGQWVIVVLAFVTAPLGAQTPWPPDISISPRNPGTSDLITLTVSDTWPHDNVPRGICAPQIQGQSIYVVVTVPLYFTINYWPTSWQQQCSVGPLPAGCHDVYVARGSSCQSHDPFTKVTTLCVGASSGGQTTALLVDSDFNASSDSAALRANSAGQDWYESRQDVPTLLTLDTTNVGGNATKKAKLTTGTTGSAYLTQEFSTPQTGQFSAQWDIYVDSIFDAPVNPDRAAWMLIGDDTGTDPDRIGPNAEDGERFVYMAFYKNGGGTTGTMDLVARNRDDTWTTFTTVATGLSLKHWYTIKVSLDLAKGAYDIYVDGQYQATVSSRTPKTSVTHIGFAQWADGPGTFYVDNVTAEVQQAPTPTPGPLLVDSDFNASSDSAALRANSAGQDWYESRQSVPTLLTLDTTNVGGNATKKAKLTASTTGSAYLTQEFSPPQTQSFAAQWDIYVDSIWDAPNSIYDCGAWMFIGDDTGTNPDRIGPNAEDSERFVYLAFYKAGGGSSGTMDLIARERSDTAVPFTTVATGLSLKRWYTIKVICDVAQDTYEVYVDGQLQGTVEARTPKSSLTHITFAEWAQDQGAATFYVDNVTAESSVAGGGGLKAGDRVILLVNAPLGRLGPLGPVDSPAVGLYAGALGTVICRDDPDLLFVSWDGWTKGLKNSGTYCDVIPYVPYSGWWMSCHDVAPWSGGGGPANAPWSTYLGGTGDDRGIGIAVDASGNVCVTGYTVSSGWTSGGFDISHNGSADAFMAKLE